MKKVLSTILVGIMVVCGLTAFTGCEDGKSAKDVFKKEITYKVVTEDFFFSTDNGATYGNRRVEFEVGQSIYMQVVICIESSDSKTHEIEGEFTMPNVQTANAQYLKGQKITPKVDHAKNITTYPFVITTNEEWTFFFEFTPEIAGTLEMKLTFDDQIEEKYDMTNTIKMVESSNPTSAIESTEETTSSTTETTIDVTTESTSVSSSESTSESNTETSAEPTPKETSESTSETT